MPKNFTPQLSDDELAKHMNEFGEKILGPFIIGTKFFLHREITTHNAGTERIFKSVFPTIFRAMSDSFLPDDFTTPMRATIMQELLLLGLTASKEDFPEMQYTAKNPFEAVN